MSGGTFTIEDLKRIMHEAAGTDDSLDGENLDTDFAALGYDSLALLETGGRIEREYGISLDDDTVISAGTPGALIAEVNARLTPSQAL
ncbi:acyl carrier protein [Streptomyces sp. NPDC000070]|uniref:acyl carrier protein n=1 Tax=Streptomyces sp. NPDC000070 TaxID=3154240 RepID=UPI00332FE061